MNKYTLVITAIILSSLSFYAVAINGKSNYSSSNIISSNNNNTNYDCDGFTQAKKYITHTGNQMTENLIIVNISKQNLEIYNNGKLKNIYSVSTSSRGIGQYAGTYKTPLGLHRISEKFGDNAPHYAIFKGRAFTGKVWPKNTPRHQHRRDHIVTRILRLEGLEKGINNGRNNGANVDTKSRAVYIHGTTMEWKLGTTATRGCVHLSSIDIVNLFNQAPTGTLVLIKA